FFFFQAEDGIRDKLVTGVQTCALPISLLRHIIGSMKPTSGSVKIFGEEITGLNEREIGRIRCRFGMLFQSGALLASLTVGENVEIGRASCRGRGGGGVVGGGLDRGRVE